MDAIRLPENALSDPDPAPQYQFLLNFQSLMTQLHCHEFYEFFFIMAGRVIHLVNGAEQHLEAGALVFVRPDDVHAYARLDHAECELFNTAFPRTIVEKLFTYLGSDFNPETVLHPVLSPVVYLSPEARAHLTSELHRLTALPRHQMRLALRGILADVFTQYFSAPPPAPSDQPEWFTALCQTMYQPEHFIAGYEALRHLCPVSQEHLTRTFKQQLGLTPTEYINHLRLEYAANLLAHTDKPIVGIALDAGFGNLSHFYHLFKRHFRIAPAHYRRTYSHHAIP